VTYLEGCDCLVGFDEVGALPSFSGIKDNWGKVAISVGALTLLVWVMPITGAIAVASYVGGVYTGMKLV